MARQSSSAVEQLIYLSEARPGLLSVDLQAILGSSWINNRRKDVTGLLLFSGRHFVQVLEGRPVALDALVQVITQDRRHLGIQIVSRRAISLRRYGSWSMNYIESLDAADKIGGVFETERPAPAQVEQLLERACSTV